MRFPSELSILQTFSRIADRCDQNPNELFDSAELSDVILHLSTDRATVGEKRCRTRSLKKKEGAGPLRHLHARSFAAHAVILYQSAYFKSADSWGSLHGRLGSHLAPH